jgi:cytochrome c-type biogenesis protein CcmH
MLGIVFTLMLGAAVLAVLWPLARRRASGGGPADADVYRSQLGELERQRAAGQINDEDAQSLRTEISRRLLVAADAAAKPSGEQPTAAVWRRRAAALVALIVMPVASAAIYLSLGSPTLPGQPLASRESAKPDQSLASLIARVEAHLATSPDDGRGWEVIAPVYLRLGRFDDAVRAQTNTVRLLGETAARRADLGEALVAQANGVVTAQARAVFERALALDQNDARGQFYKGLAAEQDGRVGDAAQTWRSLIATAPANAPWVATVKEALARVEAGAGQAVRAPTADDIAAAAAMPPGEREQMIRTMVERLAARLEADGSDVDGWLRLVRAYVVLGDAAQARSAAQRARQALGGAPEKLQRIEEGVRNLGVDG